MDRLSLTRLPAVAVLAAAVALSCTADPSAIFEDLGLIGAGLDYPHSPEQLARRREADYRPCLNAYARVDAAKRRLFAWGHERALQRTLETIAAACSEAEVEIACQGAVSALAFFSSSEDDTAIRDFLSNAPPAVVARMYGLDGAWLSNRHDPALWRAWIDQSGQLSAEDKEALQRRLDAGKRSEF